MASLEFLAMPDRWLRDNPVRAVQARRRPHSGSCGAQATPLMWLPPSTNSVLPVR